MSELLGLFEASAIGPMVLLITIVEWRFVKAAGIKNPLFRTIQVNGIGTLAVVMLGVILGVGSVFDMIFVQWLAFPILILGELVYFANLFRAEATEPSDPDENKKEADKPKKQLFFGAWIVFGNMLTSFLFF